MGGKNRQKIQSAIKELGKADKYEIYTGEVDSVDEDNQTCNVLLAEELLVYDVRLCVAMGSDKAMFVLPKKGSTIVIAQMDGGVDFCLVQASEIDKLWCKVEDMTFEMTKDGQVFNGGDNKGLVKVKELTDKINALEKDINKLKQILQTILATPVNEPGNGAPSVFQSALNGAMASYYSQQIQETQQADIENKDVQH